MSRAAEQSTNRRNKKGVGHWWHKAGFRVLVKVENHQWIIEWKGSKEVGLISGEPLFLECWLGSEGMNEVYGEEEYGRKAYDS